MLLKEKQLKEFKNIVPIIVYSLFKDENTIVLLNKDLFITLKILKKYIGFQYNVLTCISGVDLLGKVYRFCVIYELLSLNFNSRIRIKVFLDEVTYITSAVNIFINANWWEREIWDMYNIYFENHPDLRRILSDYGFDGNPLQKNFPLSGYVEVRYDISKKRIVVEPLELAQEFRYFMFETPWLS